MPKSSSLPEAFAKLGLEIPLLKSIARIGFAEPSGIQAEMIPPVLAGRDVLGQARTGTGKTAAFGLPILQLCKPDKRLQFLALVPTRELAVQVAGELARFAEGTGLRVVPVYGGQRVATQLHHLGKKPCVVVGTPGRIIDFYKRKALPFDELRFVVLDEVDRMLDIGFRDDIRFILSQIHQEHQTVLVSATLSDEIKHLAKRYMTEPVEINVSSDKLTVEEVTQGYMTVDPWDKFRLLRMFLKREDPNLAIVFCNTKRAVDKVTRRLHDAGIDATAIHGDLMQRKRDRVMDRFRKHNLHVLVATDLAARGIDVQGITHIINYDIPDDPEAYVHRIGRTARMGNFGRAMTFVTREQGKQLTEVEKLINNVVPLDEIEGFTPSPPPQGRESGYAGMPAQSGASTTAEPQEADQTPQRPRRLGGRFKPARRRRL